MDNPIWEIMITLKYDLNIVIIIINKSSVSWTSKKKNHLRIRSVRRRERWTEAQTIQQKKKTNVMCGQSRTDEQRAQLIGVHCIVLGLPNKKSSRFNCCRDCSRIDSWLSFGISIFIDGPLCSRYFFFAIFNSQCMSVCVYLFVVFIFGCCCRLFYLSFYYYFRTCSCSIVSVYNFIVSHGLHTHLYARECIRNGEVTNWQIYILCESVNSIDKHYLTFSIRTVVGWSFVCLPAHSLDRLCTLEKTLDGTWSQ